jgi:hypothetical protein
MRIQDEVIIVAVRWYLTYPLSYRQVCDMLRDRGVGGREPRHALGAALCAGVREARTGVREAGGPELARR